MPVGFEVVAKFIGLHTINAAGSLIAQLPASGLFVHF